MPPSPSSPLPRALDPCVQVRRTCGMVMQDPDSPVKIQTSAMERLVVDMQDVDIQWDEEGWHYNGSNIVDPQQRKEYVALYILALDAINFCFWPHPTLEQNTLEYDHLALALTQLAKESDTTGEKFFFLPTNLASLTPESMAAALEPSLHHYLPNLNERCRLWNELGSMSLEYYNGSACTLIDASHGSAPRLVSLLIQHFAGFRDESLWNGQWVAFYKRAQICVADLNAALQLNLQDMDQLTTFADYRVPQLLRHASVLEYNQELSNAVDCQVELTREQEVYVRAATVVAVDQLVDLYNNNGGKSSNGSAMTAVKMDWHLWQVGERLNQDGKMKPHHRVNTIFY